MTFRPQATVSAVLALSLSLIGCGISPLVPGHAPESAEEWTLAPDSGALRLTFQEAYSAQATKSDIRQIRVTLSGGPLSTPQSQTVAYPGGSATFKSLPAGSISITIEALNANSTVIGKATKNGVDVVAGQLTTVSVQLKLDPTQVDPGTGLVGVGVIIEDGDIVPLPTNPTPSPAPTINPTPRPTPSPTPAPVTGNALYVSTSGSDSNSGSASSPLRSISAAASRAKAGDTILIAGGTYYEQVVTKAGGTASAPITFRSYNGTAVIDGSKLSWTVGTNQNQGLVELHHSNVRLEGLKITNSKNTGVILNADNLTISGCEISYAQRHAVSTETGRQTAAGKSMIKNLTLTGNDIHHAVLRGQGNGQAVSIIAEGFVVSGNKVHDNVTEGIDIWLGAKYGEVVDNEVYKNGSPGIYVDGGTYIKIHRNRVYSNGKGGIGISSEDARYATRHIWVTNNLAYDHTTGDACFVWDPDTGAQNVLFAHNTLVNNKKSFAFFGSGNTVEVFNNLGYATETSLYDGTKNSTITQSNNHWMNSATGFVSAGSKDFRLTSSSPAINKGRTLTAPKDDMGRTFAVNVDFTGAVRANGAPDLGAYEYR